jgi:putative endonuclease
MKDERSYYVYIITNKRNGTLYIGVTNSLFRRSNDHREKRNKKSFTSKYNIKKLVYYVNIITVFPWMPARGPA